MESDALDPRSALDEIGSGRGGVSLRLGSPWWFHAGLGVLVAQQALVSGLAGGNWSVPSFVALVAGSAALVALARQSTGVTVARPRGPRSRGLMAARILAALACIWGSALVYSTVIVVLIAAAALGATTLLGIAYDIALRHDTAEGAVGP